MAMAVSVGLLFVKIVQSVVDEVLLPIVAWVTKCGDITGLVIVLPGQEDRVKRYGTLQLPHSLSFYKSEGVSVIAYGQLVSFLLQALILGAVVLLAIRMVNWGDSEAPRAETKSCTFCLSAIPVGASKCSHCTADVPAS